MLVFRGVIFDVLVIPDVDLFKNCQARRRNSRCDMLDIWDEVCDMICNCEYNFTGTQCEPKKGPFLHAVVTSKTPK